MTPINTQLKGQVLRQVYRVWLFRKLLPVLILEVLVLTSILYWLGRAVFFQRILENALKVLFLEPQQIFDFIFVMFAKATSLARILGFLVLVLFVLIVRHFTQGLLRLILVRENYFSRLGNNK